LTASPLNLGFLTVLREPSGYLGGYLVTNQWGRPLEFRLSTAVQPNRVQQILYAGTLEPYICADLIGKTLIDKTAVAVQLVVTDRALLLELRPRLEVPVVWVAPAAPPAGDSSSLPELPAIAERVRDSVYRHARFAEEGQRVGELLDRVESFIDLTEPFQRIREAIGEARKTGVTR
jgi:hypothetical protein